MKKQLRIFLFVTMLLLLLGVTVLAVSAAGEFQVYNSSGVLQSSHDTIGEACNAVGGDGWTVRMTDNATHNIASAPRDTDAGTMVVNKETVGVQLANKITANYTYTIDGNGHTIQTSGDTSSQVYILFTAGNVTMQNISIRMQYCRGNIIRMNGSTSLTLDGVTLYKSAQYIYDASSGDLTLTGSCNFSGSDTGLLTLTNGTRNATVKIEGGTYTTSYTYAWISASGARIWITGGNFSLGDAYLFRMADGDYLSPIFIEDGNFTVTGSGHIIEFWDGNVDKGLGSHTQNVDGESSNDVLVRIKGGTFNIGGTGKLIWTHSTSALLYQGNSRPAKNNDGIATGRPIVLVTGGTFTADSTAQLFYDASTNANSAPVYNITSGSFTNGLYIVNTVDGSKATVNISGGTFTGNASTRILHATGSTNTSTFNIGGTARFESAKQHIYSDNSHATFNISAGTFAGDATTERIIYLENPNDASVVNISGGTFTGSTHMIRVMNCNSTVNITGTTATFSGASVIIYGDYTSAPSSTQPTFNIFGGTFSGVTWRVVHNSSNAIINLGDPGATGEAATYPRFNTNNSSAPICMDSISAGMSRDHCGVLNISNGRYQYAYDGSSGIIYGIGGIINISGGTFTTSSSMLFDIGNMHRNLISPVHITGGTFTVTKQDAQIFSYNFPAYATKDVIGQIRAIDWTYGNTILKIEGGTFNVNADYGIAIMTCFDALGVQAQNIAEVTTDSAGSNKKDNLPTDGSKTWPSGKIDPSQPLAISISGSAVFQSTTNNGVFIEDRSTSRANTTEGIANNTVQVVYNISGGSFTGGAAWIRLADNAIVNISGGTFNSGSTIGVHPAGAKNDKGQDISGQPVDTRYLWLRNNSVKGGQVNISSGTFTVTTNYRMFNAAGADLNISGGTFTSPYNIVMMTDGDMVSNVTITDGTFRSTGMDSTILFNANEASQNWHEGTLRITGGTFLVDNPATASVRYSTEQTHTNYAYIEGGTFDGVISTTVTAAGHKLLITGGRFKADSGFTDYVPGRGYVGVTDDSSYKRVTAANLHGFAGSQMRLGTDLGVYFYVLKIDAVDSGTPSLVVSYDDSTLATLTEPATLANYPDGTAVESGYTLYRFTFNGLPPQRLGDDLDVVFKLTGVAKFANEFSGLRYCRQVRAENPGDDELLAITGALLNFGAAAQAYSGYRTETPVNATAADITGATAFSAVSEKLAAYGGTLGTPHFVKTEENGVAARGVRFDTGIQLYARVIDTTGEVTCTYSVAGGSPVDCEKVDLGGNRYAFYTGAITLDHFGDNVVFTLSTGETCTYSVQAFVYYYQNLDAKANEKALARALWAYKTAVVGASFNGWAGFDVADVVNP